MIPLVIRLAADSEERDDFRPVPASDRGNDGYHDRGSLGGYAPNDDVYSTPSDVRFEAGYGAEISDLERGWCTPLITDDPAYDLANYKDRSTQPENDPAGVESDFEFRLRNRKSKGFLTHPRLPTER